MVWLVMVLLVSLLALLIAALGVARFIWVQRSRARAKAKQGKGLAPGAVEQDEQNEAETEV